MRKRLAVASLFFAGALGACTHTESPIINVTELANTDFTESKSWKEGEACASWFLFFGPFGSNQLIDAIQEGGIKKVKLVDKRGKNYIIVHQRCTVAYGE